MFEFIFVVLVFVMIAVALIYVVSPKAISNQIKFRNRINGTKSHITPDTIFMNQIGAVIFIIFAFIMLLFVFKSFSGDSQNHDYPPTTLDSYKRY